MKTYRPPRSTLLLWEIRNVVMLTIILAALSWVWVLNAYYWVIVLIALLVFLFFAVFYLPRYLKNYSLTVCNNAVIIKSGVFLLHERIMPNPRLIYTERYRTPLARTLSLSGLVFHATRAATFTAELTDSDINEILKEMAR